MLKIPKEAKGTSAAVLIIVKQNPDLSNKQIAKLLNLKVRRIQKIMSDFRWWFE